MTLREHLAAIVSAMPAEAAVTLPVSTLANWLQEDGAPPATPATPVVAVDLSVEELAKLLKRKPSTIRGWLGEGRIPEAYRMNGREWRIPREALERFLAAAREGRGPATATFTRRDPSRRRGTVDLGAWRRVGSAGGGR